MFAYYIGKVNNIIYNMLRIFCAILIKIKISRIIITQKMYRFNFKNKKHGNDIIKMQYINKIYSIPSIVMTNEDHKKMFSKHNKL